MEKKLKVIVFDLDYTLWPFYVDTHFNPPFRKRSNGDIVDSSGSKIQCYPEVPEILKDLHSQGYILAIASRTSEIKGAQQLIELFGWRSYFQHKQIFPGRKTSHFNNLRKETGCDYSQMIFFDDEQRNIQDINNLGALSILVKNGVNKNIVQEGITTYLNKK